jgi:hypothetical protein
MKFDSLYVSKSKKMNYIFVAIIMVITVILFVGLGNIETNNDVTVLLPVNKETEFEREKINRLGKEFPSDQMLFIAITDAFNKENIKKLWDFCREIDKLDVVKSTLNPFNAIYFKKLNIKSEGANFSVAKNSMNNYPKTDEEINEFIENISSNRYLVGSVISLDKKTAGIVVRMNTNTTYGEDIPRKNFIIKTFEFLYGKKFGKKPLDRTHFFITIENVIKKYDKDLNIYFAGVPVYEAKTKEYMQKDLVILIFPVFIMMALTFFLSFRSTRGTILPIITILLSMGATVGIIGWIRYQLNVIGMIIPPLIMTVGSSYALHYLNSYYSHSHEFKDKKELILYSTKIILPTILFAALTTMAGFGSFLTGKIAPVRTFGVFMIISIGLTLFYVFFLLARILMIFNMPKLHEGEHISKKDIFSKVLKILRMLVFPLKYLWVAFLIFAIAAFFITIPFLKTETNPSSYFKKGGIVADSLVFLQRNFLGTNHYNVTIRSVINKKDYFKTREGLLAAKKYKIILIKIYWSMVVGWNFSPVTLIEDLNYVLNGTYDIPEDEKTIKRFFSLLSLKSVRDDGIKSIINDNFSAITFQVRTNSDNAKENYIMTEQELSQLISKVKHDTKKIADEDGNFTVEVWGELLLLSMISKYLVSDQFTNIISTIIMVFFLTLLLFRSPYYAIMSLIPLTFGVLMNFTIMSVFRISLDIATIMIAAISIGMGIDNSIHLILNYRKALNKNGNHTKEAILATLEYTARPMVFTSVALIAGFLVFLLSSFRPISFFGLLIAVAMFNCIFATLFILPSFLLITDRLRNILHKKNR